MRSALARISKAVRRITRAIGREDDTRRVSRGFLNPGPRVHLLLPLVAVAIAVPVYSCQVGFAYKKTQQAYALGDVFKALLADVPRAMVPRADTLDEEQCGRTLLLFSEQLGLTFGDDVEAAKADKAFDYLHRELCVDQAASFHRRPTVAVVTHLALSLGSRQPTWFTDECRQEDFGTQLDGLVAAMLADYPDVSGGYRFTSSRAYEVYERFLNLKASAENGDLQKSELCREWLVVSNQATAYEHFITIQGLQLQITSTAPTEQEILHLLYRQAQIDAESPVEELAFLAPQKTEAKDDKALSRDDVKNIEAFMLALLTRLHALTEVKKANLYMAAFRNYEQFAMWVSFIWLLLLLSARMARRLAEQREATDLVDLVRAESVVLHDQPVDVRLEHARRLQQQLETHRPSIAALMLKVSVDQLNRVGTANDKSNLQDIARHLRQNDASSRWSITWLARVIPALGFLGTVHGIALALMGADTIVRAATPAAQAAAINTVAGNLGIAFTTTFFALLMGIFATWLSDRQVYRERSLVNELERELGYLLDPIGFDATDTLRRVAHAPVSTGGSPVTSPRAGAEAAAAGLAIPPRRNRVKTGPLIFAWTFVAVMTPIYALYCPLASGGRLARALSGSAPASELMVLIWPLLTLAYIGRLVWQTWYWSDDRAHNRAVDRALMWHHDLRR